MDATLLTVPPPPLLPALIARQLTMLRVLGRVRMARTDTLRALLYRDVSPATMYRELQRLLEEGLIWRTSLYHGRSSTATTKGTGIRLPYVYGLTEMGLALLRVMDGESDEKSYQRLRYRKADDVADRQIPLAHDLAVSWWCLQLLADARRNPYVMGVFVQTEYVSAVDQQGAVLQRLDALVLLRLNVRSPRSVTGEMPWWDGSGRQAGDIDIRLALEMDTGSEALPVLLAKAVMYRDLTLNGMYLREVGGPLTPVFLVPTFRRMQQIAAEYQLAWPDGIGLIATTQQATHPVHGVLWGDYYNLRDGTEGSLLTPYSQDGRLEVKRGAPISLAQWNQWQTASST
jgi:DNA-binding HxlR family transcriptional regulator